jgi:predicted phosphodiesterase
LEAQVFPEVYNFGTYSLYHFGVIAEGLEFRTPVTELFIIVLQFLGTAEKNRSFGKQFPGVRETVGQHFYQFRGFIRLHTFFTYIYYYCILNLGSMRVLVLSDVHGNLAALEAVLKKNSGEWDQIFFLGDLVGYGPDPGACIQRIAETCTVVLKGNHDLAASGDLDLSDFSDHARKAMVWTREQLSLEEQEYLSGLPLQERTENILLSHGSPGNPVWGYILSRSDAIYAFHSGDYLCCFFGHTHLPSYFIERRDAGGGYSYELDYGAPDLSIETAEAGTRVLLNPGSVGFPRDKADAPRPSGLDHTAARYALFDTVTGVWQFKRIEYDMRDTADRMEKNRLW